MKSAVLKVAIGVAFTLCLAYMLGIVVLGMASLILDLAFLIMLAAVITVLLPMAKKHSQARPPAKPELMKLKVKMEGFNFRGSVIATMAVMGVVVTLILLVDVIVKTFFGS